MKTRLYRNISSSLDIAQHKTAQMIELEITRTELTMYNKTNNAILNLISETGLIEFSGVCSLPNTASQCNHKQSYLSKPSYFSGFRRMWLCLGWCC